MNTSLSSRLAAATLACGLVFAGPAVAPASAAILHGGGHGHGFHGGGMHMGGGWHGHYAGGYHRHYGYGYGGGYHGGYYGGYYGGYPGYVYGGGPGCIPVLGLVTGNYCNFYF